MSIKNISSLPSNWSRKRYVKSENLKKENYPELLDAPRTQHWRYATWPKVCKHLTSYLCELVGLFITELNRRAKIYTEFQGG